MRIAVYTSTAMGPLNDYNLRRLVDAFPNAELLFVAVRTPDHRDNRVLHLAARAVRFLRRELSDRVHGADLLRRDLRFLTQRVAATGPRPVAERKPIHLVERVNDDASVELLRGFAPDLILQAGAGILKENIFTIARLGTVNVHHGFAPEVRGMQSTIWCLYYGLHDLIGVTCHFIDRHIDTGTVICQHRHDFHSGESFTDIQLELCQRGGDLLVAAVKRLTGDDELPTRCSQVPSYYFGAATPEQYRDLVELGFAPVASPSCLPTKQKTKRLVVWDEA